MRSRIIIPAFLLFLLTFAGFVSSVGAAGSKAAIPGPVFRTPSGHWFTIRFDSSVSDSDAVRANLILATYVPKLFEVFWSPSADMTVTVHKQKPWVDPNIIGFATYSDVSIDPGYWDSHGVWVHEFTHTLQLGVIDAPGHAVRDDARLFYLEPTAEAMQVILGASTAQWWLDKSFLTPDYGVTEAIFNYNNYQSGDAHAETSLWTSLYRADPQIFRRVNARLSELSKQRILISSATDLRRMIADVAQLKILDGLPIDQWLAVEGLLSRSEVGTSTVAHVYRVSYQSLGQSEQLVRVYLQASSVTKTILVDTDKTNLTIYDALTRRRIMQSADFQRLQNYPFIVYDDVTLRLPKPPSVIRLDLHIVGVGGALVEDRSFLLPLFSRTADSRNSVLLFPTKDAWLEPISGTAQIGDRKVEIRGGILKLELDEPIDIRLTVGPLDLIRNYVPSSKVMVLGLNYSVLKIVRSNLTIITTSSPTRSATTAELTYPPTIVIGVAIFTIALVVAIFAIKRKRKPPHSLL